MIAVVVGLSASVGWGAVRVAPIYQDHMVLQRGVEVPVWGTAEAGEQITVAFAGKQAEAQADEAGRWTAKLGALEAGQAGELTVKGSKSEPVVIRDVLVGDVWICSGQSNMQWSVAQSANAEAEIAQAKHPQIRLITVPRVTSLEPTETMEGKWQVCSPESVGEFSAVGYYFGREIQKSQGVPIGLIANAWGGMPVESFMSEEMLKSDADFAPVLDRKREPSTQDAARAKKMYEGSLKKWEAQYLRKDEGIAPEAKGWAKGDGNGEWKAMELPQHWEKAGLAIDGAVWFKRTVKVPAEWAGKDLSLGLGGIDDMDVAYFNGEEVGRTEGELAVLAQRYYRVPKEQVKAGEATIAVRVFDRMADGGFYGPPAGMKLTVKDDDSAKPIPLTGKWEYRVEKSWPQEANVPPRPSAPVSANAPFLASNIYNAMVHPIVKFPIKGAIWYQGESNAGRAEQYRKLFPAMIRDWRAKWGQGDFPFLFVQLANFANRKPRAEEPAESEWAELREAQTMALAEPNTAMAVIIDIGESKDIHPKNKQDVGKRLALGAQKIAYGKDVAFSGPMYKGMKVEDGKARLTFEHAEGLKTRDGSAPRGFQVAGEDKKWQWAEATIEGDEVVVWSDAVKAPAAVRYGWGDDPAVNVYNGAGLPMSPFRTDDWEMVTAGKK